MHEIMLYVVLLSPLLTIANQTVDLWQKIRTKRH